ncbi:LOW QUALITY PROTEIN: membrane-associated transporter protein-like [Lethenteron reissneri]|uniref:LOW QUALITY PROTEIN: membrane-associated transporter protein-like n=1 Tax=Lethenteron reissneri TaxID=7753 RepID=UPI002AB7631B|nr:LOW QUALITY PROTEIN: membrane-associated transporter protein-like [Lethenteron reissneri]
MENSEANNVLVEEQRARHTTSRLLMHSVIMFGREFCYAVEAAFVMPVLLSVGLPRSLYSVVWFISPLLGFVLQPIIGSASDHCHSRFGRRRPYIVALAVLMLTGMTLFLNGDSIISEISENNSPTWAIVICMFGVVLFDFSADFIDGPIKAYLFDVCAHADKERGLQMQALLTGLGGALGYLTGAIDWKITFLGPAFGSEYHIIYLFVAIVLSSVVVMHLVSIPEMPLSREQRRHEEPAKTNGVYERVATQAAGYVVLYGSTDDVANGVPYHADTRSLTQDPLSNGVLSKPPVGNFKQLPQRRMSLRRLLSALASMPWTLRRLCISHLLGWMAFLSIMLFFTDYMGQIVYKGDPYAKHTSSEYRLYEEGVEIGCWGMCINALSSAIYSYCQKWLTPVLGLRAMYFLGYFAFGVGTGLIAIIPNIYSTLALCTVFGIMSSTLYTVPYSLVAEYHLEEEMAQLGIVRESGSAVQVAHRGAGLDCAALTCMVQLAQILVGAGLGAIVNAVGSVVVVAISGSAVALLGCVFIAVFIRS